VGESDPQLRLSAIHDGERPPNGAQDPRRAESDGRRNRSVHRGVPQEIRRRVGGGGVSEELNFVMKARREKLAALESLGVAPFAYSYDPTHTTVQALRDFAAQEKSGASPEADETVGADVRIAGRIIAWRPHGKTIFAHVADHFGRVQAYFRKDDLG